MNGAEYKGAILERTYLRDELFCSSDGRLFQRIIERGRNLEREEDFLTRGTGYDSFLKVCPELYDGDGKSPVK